MLYTATEVAEQINATKPDFKHFKELFALNDEAKIKEDFENTNCVFQKILKAQIICCYSQTHPRFWINIDSYKDFLFSNTKDMGVIKGINSYNKTEYIDMNGTYFIYESFSPSTQVAGNLVDVQNYLPKYLWNKVRTKTQVEYKQLKPDLFSLTTFKNYLEGLKKELHSTQAIKYLHQIESFESGIKQQYVELLNDHLIQPSIKFQDTLVEILPTRGFNQGLVKFMSLNRWYIKKLVREHKLLVPESVLDTLDSSYKPFITGIKRKPTTDIHELSALVGTLLVLKIAINKCPNEINSYFIEQITEHLKHPDYKIPLEEYIYTLNLTKLSIEETINEFI